MNWEIRNVSGSKGKPNRQGVVLLVVVVVVALFSLAAYSFSHLMVTELSIVKSKNLASQQRLLVQSAVDQVTLADPESLFAISNVTDSTGSGEKLDARSHLAIGTLSVDVDANLRGYYAFLRSLPEPAQSVRLGVNNESAKLNLNALRGKNYTRKQVIEKLTHYRDLREETAGGIADRLGIFEKRDLVAATKTNDDFGPVLTSFDQLLSVPGVTAELLYGEDRNDNQMLDPSENDGSASLPPDNADGKLQTGWVAHWTLIGAESNRRCDGSLKINLNQPDLASLYDQLVEFATPEQAKFVIAWRTTVAVYTDDSAAPDPNRIEEKRRNDRLRTVEERLRAQLGGGSEDRGSDVRAARAGRSKDASNTRAGINLDVPSNRKFSSLLDLASCQWQVLVDGQDTILVSPFANDAVSLSRWLPLWESHVTFTDAPVFDGRIDIMQASEETLRTVSGVTLELSRAIVRERARFLNSSTNSTAQGLNESLSVGWLLEAGLVTTFELREIAKEITVGGSVFRTFVLGQMQNSQTANVTAIELDGRSGTFRVRRALDLPPLSSSYRLPIR